MTKTIFTILVCIPSFLSAQIQSGSLVFDTNFNRNKIDYEDSDSEIRQFGSGLNIGVFLNPKWLIQTSFAFNQSRNKLVNPTESTTFRLNNTDLGLEVRYYMQPNTWFIGTGLDVEIEKSATEENAFSFTDTRLNWFLQPGVQFSLTDNLFLENGLRVSILNRQNLSFGGTGTGVFNRISFQSTLRFLLNAVSESEEANWNSKRILAKTIELQPLTNLNLLNTDFDLSNKVYRYNLSPSLRYFIIDGLYTDLGFGIDLLSQQQAGLLNQIQRNLWSVRLGTGYFIALGERLYVEPHAALILGGNKTKQVGEMTDQNGQIFNFSSDSKGSSFGYDLRGSIHYFLPRLRLQLGGGYTTNDSTLSISEDTSGTTTEEADFEFGGSETYINLRTDYFILPDIYLSLAYKISSTEEDPSFINAGRENSAANGLQFGLGIYLN